MGGRACRWRGAAGSGRDGGFFEVGEALVGERRAEFCLVAWRRAMRRRWRWSLMAACGVADALEVAVQGVVVGGGDGVELVVVAAGAGDRQAEERLAEDVDAVVDACRLGRWRTSTGEWTPSPRKQKPVPMTDSLVPSASRRGVVEQVAGDLLGDELVVGDVGVEGADDVVAVAAGVGDRVVELVAHASRRSGRGRASAGPSARRKRGEARRRSTTFSKASGEVSSRKASTSSGVGGRPMRSK